MIVDEAETNNLADDPAYADMILEYKQYIVDALADYVGPFSTARDPASNPDNFGGVWTPGWCSDADLTLH